jgi:hypothetical protein
MNPILRNTANRSASKKINGTDGTTLKNEMNAWIWWTDIAAIFSGHGVLSTAEATQPTA